MSDTPFQPEFVELIVREVIRRLRENGVTVSATNAAATGGGVVTPATSANAIELGLTDRLVTLETLRDRLQGVKRLTVGKKAIVTPAVRDELKKKIELIRI